jgi:hypothetical protein
MVQGVSIYTFDNGGGSASGVGQITAHQANI